MNRRKVLIGMAATGAAAAVGLPLIMLRRGQEAAAKNIFDPVELPKLALKNRLIRSATWEGAANPDGGLNETIYAIYEQLAAGGSAAVITGLTSIGPFDPGLELGMRLDRDELIPDYQRLTETAHQHDCRILAQIALADFRRGNSGLAARKVEIDALTYEDIAEIARQHSQGALRAKQAGFDGVQIHAAHGFFLSRCLSPQYNHREDDYGGDPQRRARLVRDVLAAVQEAVPDLHISLKINSSDFSDGGLTPEDSLAACQMLADQGINSIEVSGNGSSRQNARPGPNEAYFYGFAAALKRSVGSPVILVGGNRSPEHMNRILGAGDLDCLSMSRPLIREPNLPKQWASGRNSPSICISCNACLDSPAHRCIFN